MEMESGKMKRETRKETQHILHIGVPHRAGPGRVGQYSVQLSVTTFGIFGRNKGDCSPNVLNVNKTKLVRKSREKPDT